MRGAKWGIGKLDNLTGGVPADDLAIVESTSHRVGQLLLGAFIYEGLRNDTPCAFCSLMPYALFRDNFAKLGIDFDPFLKSGQLSYFKYNADIKIEIGMVADYDDLVGEIFEISHHKDLARLALHQVDTIVNLNNPLLTNVSAQKLATTCRSGATKNTSVLGEFYNFKDEMHSALAVALEKVASGFYHIDAVERGVYKQFRFTAHKQPWLDFSNKEIIIDFEQDFLGQVKKLKNAA